MKKNICLLGVIALALSVPSAISAQRKQSFDEGWRFHRGEAINAEAVNYDDSQWREVIVPHDFSMEPVAYAHDYREQTAEWKDWQVGPFSRLSIGGSDSGIARRSDCLAVPSTKPYGRKCSASASTVSTTKPRYG